MNESVKAALAAREKNKNTATSNKVSAALEARKTRIENEARQRNLYGILYNNSFAKDQAAGKLSPETHSLAGKAFEPENNPFHIDYKQEMARQDIADKTAKHVSDVLSKEAAEAEKEAAEKERLMSYDLEAGVKRIDDASKAISNFDINTSEKAAELDERIAASALGLSNDSRARQEAAAEKARMKQVERGEALLDEWRDAHADQQKAAELQTEALVTYNKEPDNTGINKKQTPFNTTSVSQDIEDVRKKSEMQELLFRYGFTNPKADTVTRKAKGMILDEAVLTSINAYDRLKKIEDAERSLSVTGYDSTYHNTDIIKANIEAGRYSIISDYYEALAQNDPDRDAYIDLGKERMGDFYTTTASTAEHTGIDYGIFNFAKKQDAEMTEKQLETYYYLAGKHLGYQDAYKNAIEKGLNEAVAKKDREQLEALVKEHPVIYGVPGYVANTMQSPAVALDMLVSKGTGKSYDPNSYLSSGARNASVISEEIINGIDSPTGQWWAQLGLSTAQFAAHLPFGPAGVYLMGAEAMGTTAYEAYKNGATVDEALILGAVAGVAETALEKMPFDNVLTAFKGGSKEAMEQIAKQLSEGMYKEARRALAKELGGAVVKTGIEEGMEELLTEYINNISNQLVLGERSDFNKYVNALMTEEHLTEEEAYKKAILQYYVTNPALAFAGGFVSGSAMTAGGNLVNAPRYAVDVHNSKVVARNAAYQSEPKSQTDGGASYSFREQKVPTYDELVSKPDITVVDIGAEDYSRPFKEQRDEVKTGDYAKELYSEPVTNKDTGERVFITPATLTHSFSNSGDNKLNAIKHIREIVENAVLTHAEPPTHGADNTTGVYTLFGAVRTSKGIRPVRVKIKEYVYNAKNTPKEIQEYFNKNGVQDPFASVYDNKVLVVEEIEPDTSSSSALPYDGVTPTDRKYPSEVSGSSEASSSNALPYDGVTPTDRKYPSEASTISIADLMSLVNSEYQKYLPQAAVDSDSYEAELMADDEIADAVSDMDMELEAEFTPSDGVVKVRDVHEDFRNTGKFIPDTPTQEFRKAEAAKAENDIQRSGILAGAKKSEIKFAEAMSKVIGRNIIFMTDDIRVKGKFEDGTIYVNTTRSESVFSQIVAHELTHSVESTKGYRSLVKAVKAFVDAGGYKDADGNALTFDDIVVEAHAEQDEFYKQRLKQTFTDEKAEAEAVAKVLERMFSDSSAEAVGGQVALDTWLAETVQTDKGAISRMWYALSKVAKRIRSDISDRRARGREGYDADAREAELMLRKIEDIRDRFARALVQAKKKANKGTAYSKNIDKKSREQYNSFKWATDNKVLSGSQMDQLWSKFEGAISGRENYQRTVNGEYMIPLDNDPKLGAYAIENVIAYVTDNGDKTLTLNTVAKIDDDNPIIVEIAGGILYDGELNGNSRPNDELLVYYNKNDFESNFEEKSASDRSGESSKGNKVRKGTDSKASRTDGGVDESFSVSRDTDYIGYRAVNDMEERNRERALELYRMHEEGRDIGLEKGEDVGEYIFSLTGWTYNNAGELIVDHEFVSHDTASRQAWAQDKWAHIVDAENRDLRSENEGLREGLSRALTIARDASGMRSADYTTSAKAARTIIGRVTDMFGGGYTKKQAVGFAKKFLAIYDKRGEADAYGVRAISDAEIAAEVGALVAEMQEVRIEDAERRELADKLKAEMKTPVFLSEKARGDFSEGYGKTAQAYRGKVNFVSKAKGTPVDVRYEELSGMFPDLFPADIVNEADQALKMLEVSDMIRDEEFATDDRYMFSGGEAQSRADAIDAARAIFEGFAMMDAAPKTEADRYAREAEKARRDADEVRKGSAEQIASETERIRAEERRRADEEIAWVDHYRQRDNERMEAEYREGLQRADERVDQVAENYRNATDAMAADYRETIEKQAEQAAKAYQKERIKRLYNRLKKLLDHPTKNRNIKEGERDMVDEALKLMESIFVEKVNPRDMQGLDFSYATETEQKNLEHLQGLYDKLAELEAKVKAEREAFGGRVGAGMSDTYRAELLKSKKLTNIPQAADAPVGEVSSWDDVNKVTGKEKRTLIQKLASEFDVFKRYENADIELTFDFGISNFKESFNKQRRNFATFAKMFSVFDDVVGNAVGIEVHKRADYKPDPTLKNVYVLMSAFADGDSIVPVKLEVKEFNDKQNTLYVAIALEGIEKAGVSKQGTTVNSVAQNSRPASDGDLTARELPKSALPRYSPPVNISIADLMGGVKAENTNFTKYFPRSMMTAAQRAALDAAGIAFANPETTDAERVFDEHNAEIKKYENRLSELFGRKRSEIQSMKVSGLMSRFAAEYGKLRDAEEGYISDAYDPAVHDRINRLASDKNISGKTLRQLSSTELEQLYEAFAAAVNVVYRSNNMFADSKDANVTDNAVTAISELDKVEAKRPTGRMNKFIDKHFKWSNFKPQYAMRYLGSKTISRLFNNLRCGEDVYAVDIRDARKFFDEMSAKYGSKKWDKDEVREFYTESGQRFELTLDQVMSIYAYSKREQAADHFSDGGIVIKKDADKLWGESKHKATKKDSVEIDEVLRGIVGDATAYKLSGTALDTAINSLTKEQRGFVDEMQAYLSDVMAAKGNEVSMKLYGIELFKEKFYFPLKSATQFMRVRYDDAHGDVRIKNKGMTKETVSGANNPIVIEGFMDVWASHVDEMSMYHALVLPMEDFTRVYGYTGGFSNEAENVSVRAVIENLYGSNATAYIDKLIRDINGGVRVDSAGMFDSFISKSKKASVLASLSVAIQQPTAGIRAMAYIDPKYFGGKKAAKSDAKTWEECKKYCPIAIIKEMGRFDTGTGVQTKKYITGDKTWRDKVDDAAGWLSSKADEVTWGTIWEACKREVADKNSSLKTNDAICRAAAERFNEVVTLTQVYDSVFARSETMRAKDSLHKMATSFMSEPVTVANMVFDAFVQARRGDKAILGRVISSVVVSTLVNNALKSIIYAMRDDDEDETFLEKYLAALVSSSAESINPLTYLPYVRDIWSLLQGYDVERTDVALIGNLIDAVVSLGGNGSIDKKIEKLAGAIGDAFVGVPVKNILRDLRGIYNGVVTIASDISEKTPTTRLGITNAIKDSFIEPLERMPIVGDLIDTDSSADVLYKAVMTDRAHAERMRSSYKDEVAYETALKTGLRENDERITEAADAWFAGDIDVYDDIANEIVAEGKFDKRIVVGAIKSAYNAMSTEDTVRTPDKSAVSIYTADMVGTAFELGDELTALEAVEDLIGIKVSNSGDEKKARSSIKSSVTKVIKPIYLEAYASGDNSEMERVKQFLIATGLYGDDGDKAVSGWEKEHDKENGDTEAKANDSKFKFNIPKVTVPKVEVPKFDIPKVEIPKFNFNF